MTITNWLIEKITNDLQAYYMKHVAFRLFSGSFEEELLVLAVLPSMLAVVSFFVKEKRYRGTIVTFFKGVLIVLHIQFWIWCYDKGWYHNDSRDIRYELRIQYELRYLRKVWHFNKEHNIPTWILEIIAPMGFEVYRQRWCYVETWNRYHDWYLQKFFGVDWTSLSVYRKRRTTSQLLDWIRMSALALTAACFLILGLLQKILATNVVWGWSKFWFQLGSGSAVYLSWKATEISTTMLLVVAVISTCVFIYSKEYMLGDPGQKRFMAHLLFFTTFMNIFVLSDDFITLFIGWEGVGLSSFFLINFWYTRIQANKAANKAMLVNKIGDCALLMAIILIQLNYSTLNITEFLDTFLLTHYIDVKTVQLFGFNFSAINTITALLFVGVSAKSAQLGLHTWLPDAMEGPTPVSALIHAATMVTAGVLLLIKCAPLIEVSTVSDFIALSGATTAVFAGSVATVQHDLKKIIAYSTCSQLGLMVLACGLGYPIFAFFHLVTHAFFKALLFLAAGSVVHAMQDEQDIRRMGGLQKILPITNAAFFFGNLCIVGFPFFSGFYSKELIFLSTTNLSGSIYALTCVATVLTAIYSTRLYACTMLGIYNGYTATIKKIKESGHYICGVLATLTGLSVFVGFLFQNPFLAYANLPTPYQLTNTNPLQFENLDWFTKLTPLLLVIIGAGGYLCVFFNLWGLKVIVTKLKYDYPLIYSGLVHKWFFDHLINKSVYQIILLGKFIYETGDKGWTEFLYGARRFIKHQWNNKLMHTIATVASPTNVLFWTLSITFGCFGLTLLIVL